MEYLKDALKIQKDREEIVSNIESNLKEIVKELIDLTQNRSIHRFSFRNNVAPQYYGQAYPIAINVDLKRTSKSSELMLGWMDKDSFDNLKLNEEAKEILIGINEYLVTMNEHFAKDLPQINRGTFYSVKIAKEGGLDNGKIPLYPEFLAPEQTKVKKKKIV